MFHVELLGNRNYVLFIVQWLTNSRCLTDVWIDERMKKWSADLEHMSLKFMVIDDDGIAFSTQTDSKLIISLSQAATVLSTEIRGLPHS